MYAINDNYKLNTETEFDDKKRVVSVLIEFWKTMLDFYAHHDPIFKMN